MVGFPYPRPRLATVAGAALVATLALGEGPAASVGQTSPAAPVIHRFVTVRSGTGTAVVLAAPDTLSLQAELERTRAQLERISRRLDDLQGAPRTRHREPRMRATAPAVPPSLMDGSNGGLSLEFLSAFAESLSAAVPGARFGGGERVEDDATPLHAADCWQPAFVGDAERQSEYVARRFHAVDLPAGAPVRVIHSYGDVAVEPGDGTALELVERVSLDWQGRDADAVARYLDALTLSVVRRGDSVLVMVNRPTARPPVISQLGLDLSIRMPTGHPLVVGASYGDVVLRGLDAPLTARSSFGDIEVVRTTGPLTVACQNGDIVVRRHTGTLAIDGANGAVNLIDVSGDISVAGRLSDVFGRMLEGPCALELRGGSGLIADLDGALIVSGERASLEARDVSGRVTLTSDLGDVRLARLHGGASLHVRRGSLELEESEGDVQLEARDAFARVQDPSGHLNLNAARGDVIVDARDGGGLQSLRADAVDGSVVVYVPAFLSATVDAQASGGHVMTDLPLALQSTADGSRGSGILGNGSLPVTLRATAGSVYLYTGVRTAQIRSPRVLKLAPRPDSPHAVPAVRPER